MSELTRTSSIQSDPERQEEWLLKGLFAGRSLPDAIAAALPRISGDPRKWANFLARTSLSPVFYHFVKSSGLLEQTPPELLIPCASAYHTSVARNVLHHEELSRLADIFNDRGIPLVPLKGAVLSRAVYPHMGARPMSDLDILVPRSRFFDAIALLEKAGYENKFAFLKGNPPPFHSGVQFIRRGERGNILELHWNIVNPRSMKSAFIDPAKIEELERDMLHHLTPGKMDGRLVYFLTDEFHYLSLVYHHFTHSFTDGLWFLDIALLLGDRRFVTPPERLAAAASRYGLERICRAHIEVFRRLWPVPEYVERLRGELAAQARKSGANPASVSLIDSRKTLFRVARRAIFAPKSYFETKLCRSLTNSEYISHYAAHIRRLMKGDAGLARSAGAETVSGG